MAFWKKDEAKKENAPAHANVGRNDPCHCGSEKKYKKCCMDKDQTAEHKEIEANWEKSAAAAKEQAEKQEKEAAKDSNENPSAPVKHGGKQQSTQPRHNTFIAPQVNLPRKSGGG
jgi:hypothetical protein